MNYFLYILYSTTHNRTYTEQTNDLDNRLDYLNAGKVKSTKPYTLGTNPSGNFFFKGESNETRKMVQI